MLDSTMSLCFVELEKYNSDKTGNDGVDLSSMMRDKLKELEEISRSICFNYLNIKGGEPAEQALLALRHLEDARMRYGKVIQYLGDGVSKFDK